MRPRGFGHVLNPWPDTAFLLFAILILILGSLFFLINFSPLPYFITVTSTIQSLAFLYVSISHQMSRP